MKEVKIIATIGPSSFDLSTLKQMKTAGMDIARVNTKYGNSSSWEEVIKKLNQINCKILIDIKSENVIPWLNTQRVDYVAVSFARTQSQIQKIKRKISKKIKIISKIEDKEGIKNLDALINVSDGIMVARGDLGKNIPRDSLPLFQKMILFKADTKKKFSITATEMLLSMVNSKIPERAEVSDVANAVLDGSNALMLSEETAIGKYPSLTVKEMRNIIKTTLKGEYALKLLK